MSTTVTPLMETLSSATKHLVWEESPGANRKTLSTTGFAIDPSWPMARQLENLLCPKKKDGTPCGSPHVGDHIMGVVASINELLKERFQLVKSTDPDFDH
jgi:hypothetical protein